MKNAYTFALLLCFIFSQSSEAREGICLSQAWLHKNPSFENPTESTIEVGEVLEILKVSDEQSINLDEQVLFHWYKVSTLGGREGWVYGENLAEILHPRMSFVDEYFMRFLIDKSLKLAELKGNLNDGKPYLERYLFHAKGKTSGSVVPIEVTSAEYESKVIYADQMDINQDGNPEICLQKSEVYPHDNRSRTKKEWYSIGDEIHLLHEELIDENIESQEVPKFVSAVSAEKGIIHVQRISFEKVKDAFHPTYSTCTYAWNSKESYFETFYPKSEVPLWAYLATVDELSAEKVKLEWINNDMQKEKNVKVQYRNGDADTMNLAELNFNNKTITQLINSTFDIVGSAGQVIE